MEKTKRDFDSNLRDLGIDEFEELPRITAKLVSLDKEKHLLLFSIGDAPIDKEAGKTITISTGTVEVLVKTTVHTVYDISEGSEETYLLCAGVSDNLVVRSVFSAEVYNDYFSNVSITSIDWFFKQSKEQREALIKRQSFSPKYPLANLVEQKPYNLEDYQCLFNILKSSYDNAQQKHINSLLNDAKTNNSDMRAQAYKKLNIMLHSSTAFDPSLIKIKPSILKSAIREHFSGQKAAVDAIVEAITASFFSQQGSCLCLAGPPGTGKTFIVRLIAEILNLNFSEKNLESVTNLSQIAGTDSSFHQSKPGSLSVEKEKAGDQISALLLNEIDKGIQSTENGDLKNYFAALISDRKIEDGFLDGYIYTNDFLFFTANDINTIPSHVRNRMTIISFNSYSVEDKLEIAKKHIVKTLLSEFHLDNNDVVFSDDVLKYIISEYTVDPGIRKTKEAIQLIFRKILTKFAEEEKREPVIISKEFVDSVLITKINKKASAYTYTRNKQFYSEEVRMKIEEILTRLEASDIKDDERKQLETKLRCFVKLKYVHKSSSSFTFDKEHFFDCTNSLIGLNAIKQNLAEDFYLCSISNTKPSPVLFSGSNGLGKTVLAEEIANALGKPFVKIPCGTVTLKNDLSGYGDDWISPKPGLILDKITDVENSVILFDEIDKLGHYQNSYLGDCLIDIFNDGNFYEDYLGTYIDLSKCLIICSCNDPTAIKPVLRDRLTEIKFQNYTTKEKEAIIRSSLIPNLQKEIKKSISIEDNVIRTVCEFCTTSSIREVKKNLKKLVKRALFKDLDNVLLDEKLVEEVLGPIPNHKIPDDMMTSGCSIGVAVAGDGSTGTAFRIESTFIEDGKNDLIITGLAQETVRDSTQICLTLLKKKYPNAFDKSLHINFTPAAVKKEGPSAGIGIFAAIQSLITNKNLIGYAFSGEIFLTGGVGPVGGLQEKATAALRAGCHTMFVPKEHDLCNDFVEEMKNLGLKIKPISHVDELDYIFET